jgi:hypothetical protein
VSPTPKIVPGISKLDFPCCKDYKDFLGANGIKILKICSQYFARRVIFVVRILSFIFL